MSHVRAVSCVVSWLVVLAGVASPAFAQAQPPADERDLRIAALQARVDRLEALVRVLADQQGRATSTEAPELGQGLPAAATIEPAPVVVEAAPPASRMPQELLPSLGRIGAAASFITGAHSGPFQARTGPYVGGAVELPLFRAPGGRVVYEFSAGLGQSDTAMRVTSNVAQVANLAFLANTVPGGGAVIVDAALTGRAPAPFAVEYDVTSRLQLLQVAPFGLKYVHTRFDRFGLRPYVALAAGIFVTITNQRTTDGEAPGAFSGALIGGQIGAATELAARGVPSGQGGIDLGLTSGGGLEWRARPGLSFGLDVRFNQLTSGRSFVTTALRTGLHF